MACRNRPDRRRAESRPGFTAMKALPRSVRVGGRAGSRAPETESIRAELARRVVPRVTGAASTDAADAPGASGSRPSRRELESSGGIGDRLAAFLRPSGRWGLAFAAVALVMAAGWWTSARRPHEEAIRGERHAGSFSSSRLHRTTRCSKSPGPRSRKPTPIAAILLGADLAEVGRIDLGNVTTWSIRRDSLPSGLAPGAGISSRSRR